MSTIRSATFGLMLFAGSAAVASAQTTTPPLDVPSGARARHHMPRGGMRGKGPERGVNRALAGVQLTAAEKSQRESIHQKYASQFKELRGSLHPAMQDARAARQRGDSAATRAAVDRTAGDRAKLHELAQRELSEVRGILTPDQQQRYDANVATMKQKMGGHRGRNRTPGA